MPRASGPRRQGGRYAPRYDPIELLTIVREITLIAAAAAGIDPLQVATRAYDQARAGSPYPESPRADRIAHGFGASWRRVVEVAHLTGRDFQQNLVALTRRDLMPFTIDEAAAAVRSIATRLGAPTLRPGEYDQELDQLVEEQRHSWLHGRRVWDDLPSSERIDAAYGWARVLEHAGLEPLPVAGGRPTEAQPRWTWTCERCIRSLEKALEERADAKPGELLTQRAYKQLKKGRSDLAPASAVTRTARLLSTSVPELSRELIAWRLGPRLHEPSCLERAREIDHEQAAQRAAADPLGAARATLREQIVASDQEFLAELAKFGRPASRSEIAERIGWTPPQTGKRLNRLQREGLVLQSNTGHGNRSARWSLNRALPENDLRDCQS